MASQQLSSIAAMRSERHAIWLKRQLAHKWAPIIVGCMNRNSKRNAACVIQRWLRRVLFKPIDNVLWKCSSDTPGIYLIRFCIGPDNVNIIAFGITEEEWKETGMEIPYTLVISDLRNISANGLIEIDGITYTLTNMQLKRLNRATKKVGNIKYLQDMEYMKSLAEDRKNGLV
jgi:hypothetical protein